MSVSLLVVSRVITILSNSSSAHWLENLLWNKQARWEMKALVLVIMYTVGFAYPLPCWPFSYKQLQGMSFQIHDQAKQRYAFAYTVALSFILIKQRLRSEKAQSRLGPEPSAVTGCLQELLSSQAAFHLFASLKCQSTAWRPCDPIGNPDWPSEPPGDW